jgi:hypothetical protein
VRIAPAPELFIKKIVWRLEFAPRRAFFYEKAFWGQAKLSLTTQNCYF